MARGRKKKDDDQTKQDQLAPAGPGHNAHADLTDEQQRALMIHHAKFIEQQKKVVATATADLRNLFKKAKADGFVKAEIEEFLQLRAGEGEALLKAQMERSMKLVRWLSLSIGEQATFDFSQPDRRPADDRAFELGKIAGMEGADCSPPYSAGSPQGQRWIDGWHRGQELNREALERIMNPPKKPGDADWDENAPENHVDGMPGAETEMADA